PLYDGGALSTDDPSQHDQPEDHPTRSANVTVPSRFPVNPNGPAAQGDRTVVRSILKDQNDENVVGETDGFCTTTTVENRGAEECVVTYNLPGGQLTVQGMVFGILNEEGGVAIPPPSFDNAITGGTGVFDRARGSVHADTIGSGIRRFTIDLDR
ncbi:hypothetical protein ACFXPY_49150, partial [Streptomyces sp. NPDC059153]|uniref:hypothetical protein n=1 Tax=Streptomyces sp. NPDC059153 TaxID=3346743 RepID=UPI0036C2839E